MSAEGTAANGNSDDFTYAQLREAIVSGKLLPNERIIEGELATSFGVGRGAVRTAVARLAQERLLERFPNRGARVRRISEKEAGEMREVRCALECVAARHAAAKATPGDIAELRAILSEMSTHVKSSDFAGFTDTNARFHRKIMSISEHGTAAHMLEILRSFDTRFQSSSLLTPPQPMFRYKQHKSIADAIASGDPDAAEREMRIHLSDVTGSRRDQ